MIAPLIITSIFLLFDILADYMLDKKFGKVKEQKRETKSEDKPSESEAYLSLKKEIEEMIKESETLNNPSTFAKYSKL